MATYIMEDADDEGSLYDDCGRLKVLTFMLRHEGFIPPVFLGNWKGHLLVVCTRDQKTQKGLETFIRDFWERYDGDPDTVIFWPV